jgi:aminomethyltransferase
MDLSVAGIACFVARTGYTGEDGFELICAGGQAPALWQALTAAGAWPCGLGARDTLRLEAALPLYGHELSETTNPYEAGLGWAVRLEKGEFIGRAALAAIRAAGPQRRLTGFVMESRAIPRPGFAVEVANEPVGSVTSGGPAPTLGRNIGLAYLPNALSAPGTPINIVIRERREPATTVQTPFYRAAGR